jgi:hypothetical protein
MTANLTVLRADPPDPADVPACGWAGEIVTVITRKVTGEIIRSIFDGGIVQDEAHIAIDGHSRPLADVAVQTTSRRAIGGGDLREGCRAGPRPRFACRA